MAAKIHGKNPADLPGVLERFRQYHREDLITVERGDDGWAVVCPWWHEWVPETSGWICCPPRR